MSTRTQEAKFPMLTSCDDGLCSQSQSSFGGHLDSNFPSPHL